LTTIVWRITRIDLTAAGRRLHARLAEVAQGLDRRLEALFTGREQQVPDPAITRITAHWEDHHAVAAR